jgi:hypothetical protein
MTVKTWLEWAVHDAERRGLPELKPLLEALAKATSALRTAEWNGDASGDDFESGIPPASRSPESEGGSPEARVPGSESRGR